MNQQYVTFITSQVFTVKHIHIKCYIVNEKVRCQTIEVEHMNIE
jgi:hypothetical protein